MHAEKNREKVVESGYDEIFVFVFNSVTGEIFSSIEIYGKTVNSLDSYALLTLNTNPPH